jgi:hypothetical protein
MLDIKKCVMFAVAVFLSACETIAYKEPTGGPLAKVRFMTEGENSFLYVFKDNECSSNPEYWLRLRNGYLPGTDEKSLQMPLNDFHKNAYKEVYVSAEKETTGVFLNRSTEANYTYYCWVPFTYTFREGQQYEVESIPGKFVCGASVSELINADGQWTKKLALKRFNYQKTDISASCFKRLSEFKPAL